MKRRFIVTIVLIAVLGVLTLSLSAAPTSRRAIINFEKAVKSDGELSFTFTAEGRDPVEILVKATKGVRKSSVASQFHRQLQGELSGTEYKMKMNTENQVLLEKKGNGAMFDLTLDNQTVDGLVVSIKLK